MQTLALLSLFWASAHAQTLAMTADWHIYSGKDGQIPADDCLYFNGNKSTSTLGYKVPDACCSSTTVTPNGPPGVSGPRANPNFTPNNCQATGAVLAGTQFAGLGTRGYLGCDDGVPTYGEFCYVDANGAPTFIPNIYGDGIIESLSFPASSYQACSCAFHVQGTGCFKVNDVPPPDNQDPTGTWGQRYWFMALNLAPRYYPGPESVLTCAAPAPPPTSWSWGWTDSFAAGYGWINRGGWSWGWGSQAPGFSWVRTPPSPPPSCDTTEPLYVPAGGIDYSYYAIYGKDGAQTNPPAECVTQTTSKVPDHCCTNTTAIPVSTRLNMTSLFEAAPRRCVAVSLPTNQGAAIRAFFGCVGPNLTYAEVCRHRPTDIAANYGTFAPGGEYSYPVPWNGPVVEGRGANGFTGGYGPKTRTAGPLAGLAGGVARTLGDLSSSDPHTSLADCNCGSVVAREPGCHRANDFNNERFPYSGFTPSAQHFYVWITHCVEGDSSQAPAQYTYPYPPQLGYPGGYGYPDTPSP